MITHHNTGAQSEVSSTASRMAVSESPSEFGNTRGNKNIKAASTVKTNVNTIPRIRAGD
jgi:hypothetical protein